MALSAGDKLGPYEILAPIGAGGMGEVYRARDPRMGREVAIKVSAERFSERFDREVRAVASLNHPNICQIYDVGPNYLVMEMIDGPTLAERIKEGAIPLEESLHIVHQIGDALEAAHEKGIVHRDLKPGNVKVKPDGVVKVLDFGLAKVGGTPTVPTEDSPTISMAATQAGVILGTAAYMSPEQARGKPVDKRADIWAFGVVLYEMLAGRRLFAGEDISEILAGVIKEEPRLDKAPAPVRRLLRACLEKDPKKRLRDVADAWQLLEEAPTTPATAPSPSRLGMVAGGLAVVLAVGLGAVSWLHFRETQPMLPAARFEVVLPEGTGLTFLSLSPDGRNLAFVSNEGGTTRIWLRQLDSLESHALPGTDDASYPFWSPDGANLGFFAQGKLKKISAAGGPAQTLCPAPTARGGTWNQNQEIIFAPDLTGGLYRVSAEGGVPALISKFTPAGNADSQRYPEFLPSGNAFLYLYQSGQPETTGIYAGFLDGSQPVRILPDVSRAVYVPPVPGGRAGSILFRRENTLMAQPFDVDKLRTAGEMVPLAEEVGITVNESFGAYSASENGVLLYRTGAAQVQRTLVWLERSGKRTPVKDEPQPFTYPALSPDGKRAAVSVGSLTEASDIWLQDLERGVPTRFTFGPRVSMDPVWSPDGSSIVFVNRPAPIVFDFYRKPANNAGKEELLLHAGINASAYDISPDGKTLVYSETGAKTKDDLWLLPLTENAGDRKPVKYLDSPYNERLAQFSPDGKWMAYVSDESGRNQVYVQPIPATGAKRQISTMGGSAPRWCRDCKELFYISADRNMMTVPVKLGGPAFDFGAPQPLFDKAPGPAARDFRYQPSADGKRFLALVVPEGEASAPSPVTVWLNWQAGLKK